MSAYGEQLDAPSAEAWKPGADDYEGGDSIIGEVIDVDTRSSDFGPDYKVITIQPTDRDPLGNGEPLAFHAFHTVARNEVERLDLIEGDVIGVKYLGKSKNAKKGQSPATLWKVKVFQRSPNHVSKHIPQTPPTPEAVASEAATIPVVNETVVYPSKEAQIAAITAPASAAGIEINDEPEF